MSGLYCRFIQPPEAHMHVVDRRHQFSKLLHALLLLLQLIVQAYFAKWCFSLGINLRRVEVIADDESEIVEAVRRMSSNYDFIVTSGGIGPTQVVRPSWHRLR